MTTLDETTNFQYTRRQFSENEIRVMLNNKATKQAVIDLQNAITDNTMIPEIQEMVLNRYRGKIQYFNDKLGIKSLVTFNGNCWTFSIFDETEGNYSLEPSVKKVGTVSGFSLDELSCILSAFDNAWNNRSQNTYAYRRQTQINQYEPEN